MAANAKVSRLTAEAVSSATPIGTKSAGVKRLTAEALSQFVSGPNIKKASVQRLTTEVLSGLYRRTIGLQLPDVTTSSFTFYCCFSVEQWNTSAPMSVRVQDSETSYIELRKTSPGKACVYVVNGDFSMVSAEFDLSNGKNILVVRFDANGVADYVRCSSQNPLTTRAGAFGSRQFTFRELFGVTNYDTVSYLKVAETMLFDGLLTDSNLNKVYGYLDCKWVSSSPSPANNYCIPA